MADMKHWTASPINDFEGFLHIFYCRIKNFTEIYTSQSSMQTIQIILNTDSVE
jgi:hypothetical protein